MRFHFYAATRHWLPIATGFLFLLLFLAHLQLAMLLHDHDYTTLIRFK